MAVSVSPTAIGVQNGRLSEAGKNLEDQTEARRLGTTPLFTMWICNYCHNSYYILSNININRELSMNHTAGLSENKLSGTKFAFDLWWLKLGELIVVPVALLLSVYVSTSWQYEHKRPLVLKWWNIYSSLEKTDQGQKHVWGTNIARSRARIVVYGISSYGGLLALIPKGPDPEIEEDTNTPPPSTHTPTHFFPNPRRWCSRHGVRYFRDWSSIVAGED